MKKTPLEKNTFLLPFVKLEVVQDQEEIIQAEFDRVAGYLKNVSTYEKLGIIDKLRWPNNIDPKKGFETQKSELLPAIKTEVLLNWTDYLDFVKLYNEAFEKIKQAKVDEITSNLYGFAVEGNFKLFPTSYGTLGSPFNPFYNRPAYIRIPKFAKNLTNTPIEMIVHELYAHTLTAGSTHGTAIDNDTSTCTHQKYKERLMDLLSRTILVRAGLMKKEDVSMQKSPQESDVISAVDNSYYSTQSQDENLLKHEGNVKELIEEILLKIRRNSSK